MATYSLASFYFERDPVTYDYVSTSNSTVQFVVDDATTTFSYTIIDQNPGGIPLIELSINGGYSVEIDGVTQTLSNLRFYFGQLEWGGGNVSYIVDMMFNDDPDSVLHHIFQLGGDPTGIGADMTAAEMAALEGTITGIGAITSGPFAPGQEIPFSAIPYLLDPDADVIIGTAAEDVYYAGDGSDWVSGGAGDDEIYGEAGNDELYGGDGNDLVSGGDGDDIVNGDAGNDKLLGGAGNDIVNGGTGDDKLHGNAGDDILNGGEGNDRMFGGTGADQIDGGTGNDKIHAGAGNDTIHGGDGNDTILAGTGDDRIAGQAGNDTILGQGGHDRISGGDGDDLILGGAGDDGMIGDAGNDRIIGGRGDDRMAGGSGDDIMTGGPGADTFVFFANDSGNDVITDFNGNQDTLDLSDYLLAHPEIIFTDTADFLAQYATDTGRDILLDFGNGDSIELLRVSSVSELESGLLI